MFPTFPFDLSLCTFLLPALPVNVNNAVAPTANVKSIPAMESGEREASIAELHDAIAAKTVQRMAGLQAKSGQVNPQYAQRTSLNGKFDLRAETWQITKSGQQVAELRFVKIDGAKSNIINAWIFPSAARCVPVFAAELIGVSNVMRVAFIDIQVPAVDFSIRARVHSSTKHLANRFADLPCDEPAPKWATCESTGNFTYSRGAAGQQTTRIVDCYFAYLDCYLDNFLVPSPAIESHNVQATEQLHAYQIHHMEHSPGKKFLGNLFGHDWTDAFMTDFLFATMENQ